ncbi:hypothetical protein, partial [Sinomonas sp. G460-2]|uniref:hypothetical protein n=1 Tax=Sinomonas sp. G460-2 TaxID=3393464 RepID=UPI0039EEF16A
VEDVDAAAGFTLTAEGGLALARNRTVGAVERLLDDVHAEIAVKGKIFSCVTSGQSPAAVVAGLSGLDVEPGLLGAVVELVLADAE